MHRAELPRDEKSIHPPGRFAATDWAGAAIGFEPIAARATRNPPRGAFHMTRKAIVFAEEAVVLTALIAARIGATIASKALRVAEMTTTPFVEE